jgi:hypothetical protein
MLPVQNNHAQGAAAAQAAAHAAGPAQQANNPNAAEVVHAHPACLQCGAIVPQVYACQCNNILHAHSCHPCHTAHVLNAHSSPA